MLNIIAVAIGGMVGALARYFTIKSLAVAGVFPLGVLTVNLIGCLFLGVFMEVLNLKIQMPEYVRLFVVIGLFGSFTTFSTFVFDILMLQQASLKMMTSYILASLLGGIACMLAGIHIVKFIINN